MLPDSLVTASLLEKNPAYSQVVDLLSSAPDLSGKALKIYNSLGPLDLGVLISDGSIQYDPKLTFK